MSNSTKKEIVFPLAIYSKGVGIICFTSATKPGVWDNGEVSKNPLSLFLDKHDTHKGVDYEIFMPASVSERQPPADVDLLRKELVAAAERNIAIREENSTLIRRMQELEAQNQELKQQAGYCVDEGCDHSHILHECYSGAQLSDRAVDAIIADVMKPIVKKAADRCLQDAVNARHVRETPTAADQKLQADIQAVSESAKAVGEAVHTIVERMLQPGGLLYRSLK